MYLVLSVVLDIHWEPWTVSSMDKGGQLYYSKCLSYNIWVSLEGVKYYMVMNIVPFAWKNLSL